MRVRFLTGGWVLRSITQHCGVSNCRSRNRWPDREFANAACTYPEARKTAPSNWTMGEVVALCKGISGPAPGFHLLRSRPKPRHASLLAIRDRRKLLTSFPIGARVAPKQNNHASHRARETREDSHRQ